MSIVTIAEISLIDFPARAAAFMDEIIKFGLFCTELTTFPFEDLEPTQPDANSPIFDKDANGKLPPSGLFEYKRACTSFDLALVNYMKAQ